ncbi:hypothetical protein BU26DRAFT_569974 [Trematosphaeria pertusa]|uniref:Uncharacterized protein n=1 Tax=Trematosphaeria pertusa TaxID=390896 RepID=A0A6A6HYX1_9PLEO|nr:uncharacterized protein BU26DRAFT_569974 [Trematosphaeria pertusa]KAF2243271.1 hypothetical protein BU26DRAFT_569974 [Trematosphaeria pertusa]
MESLKHAQNAEKLINTVNERSNLARRADSFHEERDADQGSQISLNACIWGPHFIGNRVRSRYDRSMEEVGTTHEANIFVKNLWEGLAETFPSTDISDTKIEVIIQTVVRHQPRAVFHDRKPGLVYDRVLLSRNLPAVMSVAKDMIRKHYGYGGFHELDDQSLWYWKKRVRNGLGWDIPEDDMALPTEVQTPGCETHPQWLELFQPT